MSRRTTPAAVLLALLPCLPAAADRITLHSGEAFSGVVVSVDKDRVKVKTEAETRVLDRASVVKIEFGNPLVTGIQGSTYTNAAYRLTLEAPEGWALFSQPGTEVSARRGTAALILNSIPFDAAGADDDMVLKGAIGGLTATVPGTKVGEPRETTFAGLKARKMEMLGPGMKASVVFVRLPTHFVMLLLLAPADEWERVSPALAEWERGFRIVP